MTDKFDNDALRMKEDKFLEYVEIASKTYGLKYKPRVVFLDGFIPENPDWEACIQVASRTIFVSRVHLLKMDEVRIKETAMHEVTHILNESHDTDFQNKLSDIKTETWKPPSGFGLAVIDGNRKSEESIEKPEESINQNQCNYHLCRKEETELNKCPYCNRLYCEVHIEPIPPTMPYFNYPKKNYQWRNVEKHHPCAEYYDYLCEKEEERHIKYSASLDRMSSNIHIEYRKISNQNEDWIEYNEETTVETKEPKIEHESELKTNNTDNIRQQIDKKLSSLNHEEGMVCSNCGKETGYLGQRFITNEETGKKSRVCAECHYKILHSKESTLNKENQLSEKQIHIDEKASKKKRWRLFSRKS